MGKFIRDGRRPGSGFNRGGFGGRGDRRGGKPTMHHAICSECGNDCEIPFKPVEGRPVFCDNCFSKQQDGGRTDRSNRRERSSSFGRSFGGDRGEKQMFNAVCDECGNECQVPFKPTAGKPILCDDCFKKNKKSFGGRTENNEELMKQIKMLNEKIDKLTSLLEPKKNTKEEKPIEKKEKKVVKKAEKVEKKTVKKLTTKKITKKKK